jgi:hypothetical protein
MRVDRPPSLDAMRIDRRMPTGPRRSWLRSLIVLVVIGGLIACAVGFLAWRRARFVLAVSAITTPSSSQCVSILTREFGGNGFDALCRRELKDRAWFRASVTNVGHSGGYLVCSLKAFDAKGNVLYSGGAGPSPIGAIAGPLVDPGQTFAWTYYMPALHRQIASYAGGCSATEQPAI